MTWQMARSVSSGVTILLETLFTLPHLTLPQPAELHDPLQVQGDGGEVPNIPLHVDALIQKFHSKGT